MSTIIQILDGLGEHHAVDRTHFPRTPPHFSTQCDKDTFLKAALRAIPKIMPMTTSSLIYNTPKTDDNTYRLYAVTYSLYYIVRRSNNSTIDAQLTENIAATLNTIQKTALETKSALRTFATTPEQIDINTTGWLDAIAYILEISALQWHLLKETGTESSTKIDEEIKATYKVIDTLNEERPYYEARDEKLGIFLCCYAIACILILIATLLLLNTFFTSTLLSTLLKSIPTTNPILRNCILIAFVIIIKTGLKIAIFALLMCTYMPLHKILIKDPFDNLPDNKNPSDTPNNHNLSEPQNKLHTLETACPPILKAIKNFPEKLPRDNWQNLSNIEKKEILNTLLKEKITRYPTTEENLLLYTTTYMLLYFILEASDRQSTPDKKLIAQVLSELNKSGNTLIKEANALRKYRVNNTETNTARTADTILEKFELLVVQLQILQQENTENKAAIGMSIDNAYSVIDQLQSEHADYKYADNVITFITYFCQFSFLIFTIANFSPLSIATSLLLGCVTGILSLCIALLFLSYYFREPAKAYSSFNLREDTETTPAPNMAPAH